MAGPESLLSCAWIWMVSNRVSSLSFQHAGGEIMTRGVSCQLA
jgi:hypothetical protein